MLSIFMCNGRYHDEDDDPYTRSRDRSSKKYGKRKVSKLVIGGPTNFKHEVHMGYDEISSLAGSERKDWDLERVQRIMALSVQLETPAQPLRSNEPESPTRGQVRRKPAPELFLEEPQMASQNRLVDYRHMTQESSVHQTAPSKPLVPLLGSGEPRGEYRTPYVTQTAKLRFDGALQEIERALKDDTAHAR